MSKIRVRVEIPEDNFEAPGDAAIFAAAYRAAASRLFPDADISVRVLPGQMLGGVTEVSQWDDYWGTWQPDERAAEALDTLAERLVPTVEMEEL